MRVPAAFLLIMAGYIRVSEAGIKPAPTNTSHIDKDACSQTGIKCSIVENPGCDLAPTWPSSSHGHGVPGPPRHLALATHFLPGEESHRSWSGVNVSWSMPDDRMQALTGFEVRIRSYNDPDDDTCLVVNLAQVKWSANDVSRTFYLDSLALSSLALSDSSGHYAIHVRSLPVTDALYAYPSATITVPYKPWDRGQKYVNGPEHAAYWAPDLVVLNDSCSHTVTVTFPQAPRTYNFQEYIVELINGTKENQVQSQVFKGTGSGEDAVITFPDVPMDQTYFIKLHVFDTDQDTENCRCKCDCDDVCPAYGCIETRSLVFDMKTVSAQDCVVPELTEPPTSLSTGQWVGVGIGVALGLAAAVIVGVCLMRLPKKPGANPPRKLRVYIWFSDHADTQGVIAHLIRFLRHIGKFDVQSDLCMPFKRNKADWVFKEMTKADKIILVQTQDVLSKMTHFTGHGISDPNSKDGFLLGCRAWSRLSHPDRGPSKIIILRLGTGYAQQGLGLQACANLQLMRDAFELIQVIRGVTLSDLGIVEPTTGQRHCLESEEGARLLEAIDSLAAVPFPTENTDPPSLTPQVSVALEMPPGVPHMTDTTQGRSSGTHMFGVPQMSDAPHMFGVPQMSDAPHMFGAPQMYDAPHMVGVPQMYDAPHMFGVPQMSDAPQISSGAPSTPYDPSADVDEVPGLGFVPNPGQHWIAPEPSDAAPSFNASETTRGVNERMFSRLLRPRPS